MNKNFLIVILLSLLSLGCNSKVPTGHVGMVKTINGFQGDVLAPGHHSCFGRDTMHLVEVSDKQYKVDMNVLCKDKVNFKFSVGVLAAVDRTNTTAIKTAFQNVTPAAAHTLTAKQLFDMYCRPVVDQESRKCVSKYETEEVAEKRIQVIEEIRAAVKKALKGSLVTVKRVTVNNLDFPDELENAQKMKLQRKIEIQTIAAEEEKKLVRERNKLKVAQLEYKRRLIEGAMISDFNRIVGDSITPQFIAWWQLKVFGEAAKGPNNWGFIPYTDHSKSLVTDMKRAKRVVLDDKLRARLEAAKKSTQGIGDSAPTVGSKNK